ncbi:MAG: hypothetical protein O2794_00040 [bacterium]|nr:hypothetical protein [bacterium]
MVTPELIAFVRHSREKGMEDSGVMETLRKQGWSEPDIHEAFGRIQGRTTPQRRGSLQATIATIILLIAFWPAGLVLMWAGTNWPKSLKVTVSIAPLVLLVFIFMFSAYARSLF